MMKHGWALFDFDRPREESFLIAIVSWLRHPSLRFANCKRRAQGLERHIDEEDNPEYARWLNQLLAPGSSLGGARPKASVRDETGNLCIAKFPSRADTRDMAAWEMLAHRLGAKCRHSTYQRRDCWITASESNRPFWSNDSIERRSGGRLAFVSAMTLTQRRRRTRQWCELPGVGGVAAAARRKHPGGHA